MIQQRAIIKDCKKTEAGMYFVVHVPDWTPDVKLSDKCELWLNDGRTISTGQRRFVHALLNDIKKRFGWSMKEAKVTIKQRFIKEREKEYFSLSNTDMTTAREFIEFVIAFMFSEEVAFSVDILPMVKSVNTYFYMCLINKVCCVCGSKEVIHIHHRDPIGKGMDRTKVDHTRYRLMALCAYHHVECHAMGQESFNAKYHVDGIYLNKDSIKKIGL